MCRNEDRCPLRARHLREQIPKQAPRCGIDGRRRLVEHEERGTVENRAAEREPLFLPARETAREHIRFLRELHAHEHFLRACAPLRAREAVESAVEHHILAHRHIRIEAEPLGHIAERLTCALRMRRRVTAEHERCAARRREDAADHADRRGLSRAVRSDESVDCTARHGEVQMIDGGVVTKDTREIMRYDHRRIARMRLTFHDAPPDPHRRACRALGCRPHCLRLPLRQRRGSPAHSS